MMVCMCVRAQVRMVKSLQCLRDSHEIFNSKHTLGQILESPSSQVLSSLYYLLLY